MMTRFIRWLLKLAFRFRGYNEAVLNTRGPVLLIPNHVSWFDWLLIAVCLDEDWKFVVSSVAAQTSWLHRRIMLGRRCFPIDPASPYAVKRMAEYLQKNGRMVLFAEGRLSRTGALMKLFDGTGFLLHRTGARVITAYIRGAYQLPFSPNPSPKRLFPKIEVHFSEAQTPPKLADLSNTQARVRLTDWLRDQMVRQRFTVEMEVGPKTVLSAIVETARARPKQPILEDVTRTRLNYRRLLVGADLLSQVVAKRISGDTATIGILLPNVNSLPVLLMSLWRLNHTPAVLNFSTGIPTILTCAQLAGIKHIFTSKTFLEKARLDLEPLKQAGIEIIYLEDLRGEIGSSQKLISLLKMTWKPASLRVPMADETAHEQTAVILFTSGSEGVPKGVKLSHKNILANIRQMLALTDIKDDDRLFNCLPLFHSFGLTVGTLLPLVRGLFVFVYPSPLHYRLVPTIFYDLDCTVFLSTNTFLNGYARKAHPYDFRSLRYLFAAAEKLQEATANTWSQKYGVRILEGYGATECSPCVSVNTPLAPRYGSVGRLLPGMEARFEPVEGVADGGRMFVRGPNIMAGYVNEDANAKFKALAGWYDTGDIVGTDPDGYLFIRGRLKRFAKVSGEMVSLTAVEDALAGAFTKYGQRCQVAVVAVPHEGKGEALVAITNEAKLTIEDIRAAIKAKGLGNLSVPREIKVVAEIPKLGTGKIDHRRLAAAMEEKK